MYFLTLSGDRCAMISITQANKKRYSESLRHLLRVTGALGWRTRIQTKDRLSPNGDQKGELWWPATPCHLQTHLGKEVLCKSSYFSNYFARQEGGRKISSLPNNGPANQKLSQPAKGKPLYVELPVYSNGLVVYNSPSELPPFSKKCVPFFCSDLSMVLLQLVYPELQFFCYSWINFFFFLLVK